MHRHTFTFNDNSFVRLERCPTYKEQLQQIEGRIIPMVFGLSSFTIADILFIKLMPSLREDQAPHLELAREVARRFNYLYQRKVFPEPATLFNEYKLVPGLDNRKMSKSYNNVLEISTPPEKIAPMVRMMITDPGRIRKNDPGNPDICSVYSFQRIFNQEGWAGIEESCRKGEIGCVQCKNSLARWIERYLEPIYARRKELEKEPQRIDAILEEGKTKAVEVARKTMEEVRTAMGI